MPNEMTPAEALNFLDTACASVAMGRPAHVQGIQAVQVLKGLIESQNGNGSEPKKEDNSAKETETEK